MPGDDPRGEVEHLERESPAQGPRGGESVETHSTCTGVTRSRRPLDAITAIAAIAATIAAVISAAVSCETLAISDTSQLTSRYTAAVAELGDSSEDVRFGGIYALSRLANDSPHDRPAVINVLAAYARNHVVDSRSPTCSAMARPGGPLPLPNDVGAALQVLGGLNRLPSDLRTTRNLSSICLARTTVLQDASYAGFNLTNTSLSYASLTSADLTGADLRGADLTGADLTGANLTRANITGANLTGARLAGTDLTGVVRN